MALLEQIVLEDTIEINTTPEKIWEFWAKMDENYKYQRKEKRDSKSRLLWQNMKN